MSLATFETQVGPNGAVTVHVPAKIAQENQKVIVTVRPRPTTLEERAEWLKQISALHGSITDPEFKRHPRANFVRFK